MVSEVRPIAGSRASSPLSVTAWRQVVPGRGRADHHQVAVVVVARCRPRGDGPRYPRSGAARPARCQQGRERTSTGAHARAGMQRFKSPEQAQRFLETCSAVTTISGRGGSPLREAPPPDHVRAFRALAAAGTIADSKLTGRPPTWAPCIRPPHRVLLIDLSIFVRKSGAVNAPPPAVSPAHPPPDEIHPAGRNDQPRRSRTFHE